MHIGREPNLPPILIRCNNGCSVEQDTNRDVHKCNVHCNVVSYTVKLSEPNESEVTVKARCYRSMKKNEQPHLLQIIFRKQDQPDVVSFSCSCAAGKGFCHHIAGLLSQLSDFECHSPSAF